MCGDYTLVRYSVRFGTRSNDMEFKDYYKILGVSPDADENTIKSTYRKLARQLHPDVNPGNKDSGEKFKEVNEAYQVLSDPEQRKKYDALRAEYQRYQSRSDLSTHRQPWKGYGTYSSQP